MGIRKQIRLYRERQVAIQKAKHIQSRGQIHFYNFWLDSTDDKAWLDLFIREHQLLPDNITLGYWSVFGDRNIIHDVSDDINIFFTGENVHWERFELFSDYMLLESKIDLALGFDYFEHPRYLRFPLWILSAFNQCFSYQDVCKRCQELRYPTIEGKTKSVAAIARWGANGVRGSIADAFQKFTKVDYPGGWRHNDDSLKNIFGDNKKAYLQQYIFNICPENTNSLGYVTEKVFDAIEAGCIPVYSGSYNCPDATIINTDAIIFYDHKTSQFSIGSAGNMYGGGEIIDLQSVIDDEKLVNDLLSLPRLKEGAEDIIWQIILDFETQFKQLVAQFIESKSV